MWIETSDGVELELHNRHFTNLSGLVWIETPVVGLRGALVIGFHQPFGVGVD